jgi:F0F1-type ATP synthase assembly protein I
MEQNNQDQEKNSRLNSSYARFSGIVVQMIAIIGIGTFIGVKLDDEFPNENKLFTLILSLSSVILSIVYVIRRIIAASKDNK